MYGAICADIMLNQSGVLEKDGYEYPLRLSDSMLNGNSVLTLAIAEAVINYFNYDKGSKDLRSEVDQILFKSRIDIGIRKWISRYPVARDNVLLVTDMHANHEQRVIYAYVPAARISPISWLFSDVDTVRKAAVICSSVTDDDPTITQEAEAVASAIYFARMGKLKKEIIDYISEEFGYEFYNACDKNESNANHEVQGHGRISHVMKALMEGGNYEDVVRKASSFAKNNNDVALIAGSIAHAYYGVRIQTIKNVERIMTRDQFTVCERYQDYSGGRRKPGNITGYISAAAIRYLPAKDREIARYYADTLDVYKTAEWLNEDVNKVIRIANDLKYQSSRTHCIISKQLKDYLE